VGMGLIGAGGSLTNVGLVNGFGMGSRSALGMAGMPSSQTPSVVMQGQNGSGTGPQEWEWLTMSL
jgi:GATA-binding protein